jgi:predicted DNA-binding transcriptional regulator YafY
MLDSSAIIPPDFDLKAYFGNAWGVFRGTQTHDVQIRFSRKVADIVTETCWHHSQKIQRSGEGEVILHFRVDGLTEILRWVLGWAGTAKIIAPDELRTLAIEHHRQAIEINQDFHSSK